MNNFYYYSKQLLKILEENKEILNLIFSIDKQKSDYIINPQEILNFGGNSSQQVQGVSKLQNLIREKNSKILNIVRTERPNKVYELINKFLVDLNLFDKSYNDESDLVKLLKDFSEKHTDAYAEKDAKHIFSLIETSSKITQSINDIKEKSYFIINEFEKESHIIPTDYLPLRISTDQDIPLVEDLIKIFKNLDDLYAFICILYKVDSKNKPLILNNVNTGSWFTELLGIKQVVLSIENLLKGIGQFIRDYITGKIDREKFENQCKKAEAFIHLMKTAKENGIDNAELGIFKSLNPLISNFKDEPTTIIDVNEDEILKLQKNERLTLLDRKDNRTKLLEKINLEIEEGSDKKTKK